MGIFELCAEYTKLHNVIEEAKSKLHEKTYDWGIEDGDMITQVNQLPFGG